MQCDKIFLLFHISAKKFIEKGAWLLLAIIMYSQFKKMRAGIKFPVLI